jgi:hypothetical protein
LDLGLSLGMLGSSFRVHRLGLLFVRTSGTGRSPTIQRALNPLVWLSFSRTCLPKPSLSVGRPKPASGRVVRYLDPVLVRGCACVRERGCVCERERDERERAASLPLHRTTSPPPDAAELSDISISEAALQARRPFLR